MSLAQLWDDVEPIFAWIGIMTTITCIFVAASVVQEDWKARRRQIRIERAPRDCERSSPGTLLHFDRSHTR